MHILRTDHTTTMSSTPAPTGAAAGVSRESHVPMVGTTIPVQPTGEDVDVHDNFQDNYHLDDGGDDYTLCDKPEDDNLNTRKRWSMKKGRLSASEGA